MLRRAFRLGVRRIAGRLENARPLDLTPVEDAAEAVADREAWGRRDANSKVADLPGDRRGDRSV
jgi:hypothetical protein